MTDNKIGNSFGTQTTPVSGQTDLAGQFEAFLKKNGAGGDLLSSINAQANQRVAEGEEQAYLDQISPIASAASDSVAEEQAYLDQWNPIAAAESDLFAEEQAYLDQISPIASAESDLVAEEQAYLDQWNPTPV